jgi:hypothetical protein
MHPHWNEPASSVKHSCMRISVPRSPRFFADNLSQFPTFEMPPISFQPLKQRDAAKSWLQASKVGN